MGSQIEQLKNRAKEYAKAYHEKEVKRSVHKGEMEEILRQAEWLMEQKFCFCDRWDMEPCSTVYEVSPFSWDTCPNGDPEWVYMLNRQEYLKKMLLGEYSQTDAYKYAVKFGVKEIPCFVLAIRFTKAYPETEALLKQYADAKEDCVVKFDDKNFAFVKAAEPSEEYSSPAEYAGFLAGFLTEELGARVCIGAGSVTGGFHDLQLSYSRAVTALRYAEVFSGGEGVHSYKEYMLVKLLEEVPKSRLDEFLSDITEEQIREVFDDEEMLLTAEKFLSASLNVSETSRALYMHRNTLLYRLDKIEKATGLNIRLFPDAVTFRILIIIYKLSKK